MYNGGGITTPRSTVGGNDTIDGIEDVLATDNAAFAGPVLVDASGFHGNVDVTGSPLGDTLIGGSGDDTFRGTRATTPSPASGAPTRCRCNSPGRAA